MSSSNEGGGGGALFVIMLGAAIIVVGAVLFINVENEPADDPAKKDGEVAQRNKPGNDGDKKDESKKDGDKKVGDKNSPTGNGDKTNVNSGDGKVEWAPVEVALPFAAFPGTPKEVPKGLKINKKMLGKKRPQLMAPKGSMVLSERKKVTSSDKEIFIGELSMVTDGDKEADSSTFVELRDGPQWVQIDLEKSHEIMAVFMWHNHMDARVYRDVVVQVSDDPEFKKNVTTIFNNDHDNSLKFGKGDDYEYFESDEGGLAVAFDRRTGKGVKARYVRCWSNGSTDNDQNHYNEVEVWGLPGGETGAVVKKNGGNDVKKTTSTKTIELAELPVELPNPAFAGTPKEVPKGVRIDKRRHGKKRGKIMAPKGLKNVSFEKPVTSSDTNIFIGEIEFVTDGEKDPLDSTFVELAPGKQWVQVDLEAEHEIGVIMVWHYHLEPRVYRDMVVEISNDKDFIKGVTVVYNNDHDNSLGKGAGKDYEYFESEEGEAVMVFDAKTGKGRKARYVRVYSKGSTENDANHFTEVEVWAMPNGKSGEKGAKGEKGSKGEKKTGKNDKTDDKGKGKGKGKKVALVPLPVELPNPAFAGTPKEIPKGIRIDKKRHGKKRGKIMAPKGLKNVAFEKPVTSSDDNIFIGEIEFVTDGEKDPLDSTFVELAPGKQWVQIDLKKEFEIGVILVWHYHSDPRVYRDVVIQISNDKNFKKGVVTVYNNDHDNSSKFGVGKNYEYFESEEGEAVKVFNEKTGIGKKARYVRLYSNGSTENDSNHVTEVEVWAKPVTKGKKGEKGAKGAKGEGRKVSKKEKGKTRKVKLAPLPLELPDPAFVGTPKAIPKGVRIDKKRHGKKRGKIMAPKGLKMLRRASRSLQAIPISLSARSIT